MSIEIDIIEILKLFKGRFVRIDIPHTTEHRFFSVYGRVMHITNNNMVLLKEVTGKLRLVDIALIKSVTETEPKEVR